MEVRGIVKFECPVGHNWNEPPPNPASEIMMNLYGTCPACPGRVQGTAKPNAVV